MDVDFDTGKTVVTMQPGKTLTREQCVKAFEGTKYTVQAFDQAPS